MYTVKEVAQLSGVTVRALHYYDAIGLLCPSKSPAGYRQYFDQDLDRLQLILAYKALDFSLDQIRQLLSADRPVLDLLQAQLALLQDKKDRLLTMIQTLERTIQAQKGEITMSQEEKFQGFKWEGQDPYRQEAEERYGKQVVEDSYQKMKGKETIMLDLMNQVFEGFAKLNKDQVDVSDPQAQSLAHTLYQTICQYSFDCSLQVFKSIGQGYVSDPRFTQNIDQFGPGTAQYACQAIEWYVGDK